MTASHLDRIVTLQSRAVSRDRFGGEVETWADVGEIWARVRITGVREQYVSNADREQALRNAIMRVRFDEAITAAEHRIIWDDHAWDILGLDEIGYRRFLDLTVQTEVGGVDFLPRHYNIRAGLSDDDQPVAAEFTLGHTGARIDFPAFSGKHMLLWRDVAEPELTTFVLVNDITHENQLAGFTKFGMTVEVNGTMGNVWVSNQLLTFAEAMSARVA